MKISKLLVLSALWLVGLSASAEIVDGVRQKPVPTTQGFVVSNDTTENYYLYNINAKAFFTEGNAWGTQVSIGDNGLKVAFTMAEEGVYHLNDYSLAKKAWKLAFFDSETQMYVDLGSQANYGWAVEENGATFRLHAADSESFNPSLNWTTYPDMYVGLDITENPANTACSPFLTVEEGHYVDWAFVAPENMATWLEQVKAYNKAQELLSYLEQADACGADVTAQKQVYLNEASTVEEIDAAIEVVKDAIAKQAENAATVDNPMDMTSLIVNPSYDNNTNDGWSGTAPAFQSYTDAEHYDKNYDTYQQLSGMPNGVYVIDLQAFYRAGYTQDEYTNRNDVTKRYAKIYAVTGADTLTTAITSNYNFEGDPLGISGETSYTAPDGTVYTVPNNMQSAEEYFKVGHYHNKLYFGVDANSAIIGLYKKTQLSGDWTIWDNWKLTYFGNAAAAYQMWVEKSIPTYNLEDAIYTPSYLSAFEAVAASAQASTKEEALAAIAQIKTVGAELEENISLWQQWQDKVEEGRNMAYDTKYEMFADDLATYCDFDYEDILDARELTNDQLKEEIAKIEAMMEKVKDDAIKQIEKGTDVTDTFLTNADFEQGNKGWQGVSSITAFANSCAEAYEKKNFDLYQVVKGAPKGVYEISLQGFYRLGANDAAYRAYKDAKQNGVELDPVAWVYLNSNATPLNNVYDIEGEITSNDFFVLPLNGPAAYESTDANGNTVFFPNGMSTSQDCFNAGMYKRSAYGLIAEQGDEFRIGIKGNLGSSQWAIWDNFRLVYQGFDATVIKPILEDAIAGIDASNAMGKSIYAKVSAAVASANEALATGEGNAMFKALSAIFALNEEISESVALFKTLKDANEGLMEAIGQYDGSPVAGDAVALFEQIDANIANHEYENEDVEGLILQIKKMKTKLRLPAEFASASDSNPVDVTAIVETPDFEKDGANSIEGWTTEGHNFGNNDEQKGAMALEFYNKTFDIHQDIIGLPAGTYELSVSAFCRNGGVAEDYATFQEKPDFSEAYVYAVNGDSTVNSVPVAPLFKGAVTEDPGIMGEGSYTPEGQEEGSEVTYYFPNDMVSAVSFFSEESLYTNKLILKVLADETVTIGMKKTVNTNTGWVLLDGWKLTYYGANSSLQPSEDAWQKANGIQDVNVVAPTVLNVEYFTIDGRKAGLMQKGIIIVKQTMSNGSVIVKKIRK